MFTGIVTDIGEITSVTPGGNSGDRRFVVRTRHDMAPIAIGASIACSGCCLTVVEKGADWFAVEVSGESLAKTHLGDWKLGSRINLELSLKLGDELGGHLVYGHVDGVGHDRVDDAGRRQRAFRVRGAGRAGALRRLQGLGGHRWHFPYGE